uniref:Uncharacterized protein n=1 Tax=Alexandrium catenella TaxID=2925 RepID=A0A7S1PKC1_ALECA
MGNSTDGTFTNTTTTTTSMAVPDTPTTSATTLTRTTTTVTPTPTSTTATRSTTRTATTTDRTFTTSATPFAIARTTTDATAWTPTALANATTTTAALHLRTRTSMTDMTGNATVEALDSANSTTTTSSTSTTSITTTAPFRCTEPSRSGGAPLADYADCLRDHCHDIHPSVLDSASNGQITDCFLLLEVVGSCDGDATSTVPSLPANFTVGNICGEKCPSSCSAVATTTSSPSEASSPSSSTTFSATASQTTTELRASLGATLRRDIVGRMSLTVDSVNVFVTDYRVVQALKGGISAPLKVSAGDVSIPSIMRAAVRRLSESVPGALRRSERGRRRLASGTVNVLYEVRNAPATLTPASVVQDANAIKAELNRQLQGQGMAALVSDIAMDMPTVEYRVVPASAPYAPSTTVEVVNSNANSCAQPVARMLTLGSALVFSSLVPLVW